MRENRIRKIWQEGGAVVNGWLHIANGFAAESMAHAGWDSLTIDMQHGPVGFESAVTMLQAISTSETVPMARVPWNEPGIIMRLLDAGCYGLICPMVNTREQCEAFVQAMRYPPLGYRSFGPTRVKLYAGEDYAANANETVVAMAMVETAEALENLADIVATPTLDGIYIGPADLNQSLGGIPKGDHTEGPVYEALDHIVATCNAAGVMPGIHCGSPHYARQMIERGFRFVTIGSDARLMVKATNEVLAVMREGQQQDSGSGMY